MMSEIQFRSKSIKKEMFSGLFTGLISGEFAGQGAAISQVAAVSFGWQTSQESQATGGV